MARRLLRGDLVLHEFKPPDKSRPVLVLSRDAAIAVLDTVMVAPVTSRVRGIPSEVPVGPEDGFDRESVVNLDHVQTVPQRRLGRRLGRLDGDRMVEVCEALAAAVACGSGGESAPAR